MADTQALAAACLQALGDSALRDFAGEGVFKRGQTYAASGAVQDAEVSFPAGEQQIALYAEVQGTQLYQAHVVVDADLLQQGVDPLFGECDCQHAQDGYFCKHQVALALTLRGKIGGAATQQSAEAQKKVAAAAKRAQTQAANRNKLQEFLQSQSAAQLAQRMWQWAEQDRGLMADIKAWAAQAAAGSDPKAMKTAISDMLKASGFLDWHGCRVYAQRAAKVLPLLEQAMAIDVVQARALCEHALMRLYKAVQEADDSSGLIGGIMAHVQALLLDTLRASPPDAGWLDTWFALMEADPWGNWVEADVLEAAGQAVQAAYHRKVAADWHAYQAKEAERSKAQADPGAKATPRASWDAHPWDYKRHTLRQRYLTSLQRQGDVQAALDVMRNSAQDANEHSQLVAFCETHQRYREALQFAQAATKLFPTDWRAEADLLRCYERDGWDEEALAIRQRQLEAAPRPEHFVAVLKAAKAAGKNVAAYREALYQWAEKKELEPKPVSRWVSPAEVQRSKARDVSVRVEWLMAEGLLQEALALVQAPHPCGVTLLERLALKLPAEQQDVAATMLQRVFEADMPRAQTPYTEVLQLVLAISQRLPAAQRSQWLARLRAEYKAKRNFIKGLDALGL